MFDKNKVIKIAINEVGYLEKSKIAFQKNPQIIYEKTVGAGQDNITKYNEELHKIYPAVMDTKAPWCDAFVDWCFVQAFGIPNAKEILCGNFDDYTVNSCKYYEKANRLDTNPQIGDQVFFTKNGKSNGCYHTGLVYDVDGTYFYTIEGNTSNSNTVVANGGCVAKKKYIIKNYINKVLFGHPKYGDVSTTQLKSIDEIAQEVLDGKWGNEPQRRIDITNAGYNYALVKARVNEIYKERQNSKPIIDVSHHNTVVDWNKVANAISGVIIRLGYRSYGSGQIMTDKKYANYLAQVKQRKIPYGIYFFPTSINEAEAEEEANYILKSVSGLSLSFPIYLDSEIADVKTKNGRSDKLDKETRTKLLKIILDKLKSRGYDCGVYASTSWLNNQLIMSKLNGYKVWVAQYNTACSYTGNYNMWQYSSKGHIDGINGDCDVSKLK